MALRVKKVFDDKFAKQITAVFGSSWDGGDGGGAAASARPPSVDEKKRFSQNIYSISAEELGKVVQQLDARCEACIKKVGRCLLAPEGRAVACVAGACPARRGGGMRCACMTCGSPAPPHTCLLLGPAVSLACPPLRRDFNALHPPPRLTRTTSRSTLTQWTPPPFGWSTHT